MIDVNERILTYLSDVSGVTDLTSTARLYAGRDIPPKGYAPNQGAALVWKVRGGSVGAGHSHLNPSVQFKAYGLDEVAATALDRALFDAFQRPTTGLFKAVEVEVLGQLIEEPQTGWVAVLSFYKFWFKAQ